MKSLAAWLKQMFWKYAIGIAFKLFSRDVTIEGLSAKVAILPVVWKGKLHILGLDDTVDFVSLEFIGRDTIRLISAPVLDPGPAQSLQTPVSPVKVAHVILCHLPAQQTDGLLDHSRKMSDDYDLILAYGGTPGEFKNIRYSNKIYIEDPSLRGSLTKLNFDEILNSLVHYYAGKKHPDWLYIGDYDVIPTRRNYLDESIATARRHQCTFAAKSVRDITSSNCRFITEETLDRTLGWCADNNLNRNIRIYHVLGASLLFSWGCLEGMLKFLGRFPKVYNEVGMPTAAALAGHRLLSMDACCKEWAHIRYRPPYGLSDLEQLQKEGVALVHPVKDIGGFLKLADTLQKAAQDQT